MSKVETVKHNVQVLDISTLTIINEDVLQKAVKSDRTKAKALHPALPPGGVWRSMNGHHIYILNGKILAGAVPNATGGMKKATKAHLAEHQETVNKEAKKAKAKAKVLPKSKVKPATGKKAIEDALKDKKKAPKPKAQTKADVESALKGKKKAPKVKPQTKQDVEDVLKLSKPKLKVKDQTKADIEDALKPATKKKTATVKAMEEVLQASEAKRATTKTIKRKGVNDIRTEKQANNELAYDVGTKIGGARKDLAVIDAFVKNLSGQSLDDLEGISAEQAQKLCVKKNLLKPVDFDAEYKRGTDIDVALTKQLIYDRILPKPKDDSPEERASYLHAIQELQRGLEPAKSWDEFKKAVRNLGDWMRRETPKNAVNQQRYLAYAIKNYEKDPTELDLKTWRNGAYEPITKEEYKADKLKRIRETKAEIELARVASESPYAPLGEKLTNFFTDSDSSQRTMQTVANKNLSWDKYLAKKGIASEAVREKKKARKEKWTKEMPAVIKRSGGRATSVKKPEEMINTFGFKGIEFGNWIDDKSGNFHLIKCAEAFHDLADILKLKDKDVSMNGKLSMAFGARGSGKALAHYEPLTKAINITKEGGAGTLAHEWGHAMDNILYQASAGRNSTHLASEGMGDEGDKRIKASYDVLMDAILKGDGSGVDYVDNKDNDYYSYYPKRRDAVKELGVAGAVQKYAKQIDDKRDSDLNWVHKWTTEYSWTKEKVEKETKKILRKHTTDKNGMVQEMAFHHKKLTGETLEKIPMPNGMSQFYTDSKNVGGDTEYWTSSRELFARAFETYVEGKMKTGKIKNDYLVHGAWYGKQEAPYPRGKERDAINGAFDELMKNVRNSGAIQKGLAFDLQKGIHYFSDKDAEELANPTANSPFNPITDLERMDAPGDRSAYNVASTEGVLYIPTNRLQTPFQTVKALNFDKVRANVIRMENGENLEPVVIGWNYEVHDGHHRLEASRIQGYTHVPCVIGKFNDIDQIRLFESYSALWKSLMYDSSSASAFPYEHMGYIYRGIGQKEFNAIQKNGYIQTKGKGNDDDQEKRVTCFTYLFSQAEGYARSNYDLYNEVQAYVLAVEWSGTESELGEIEVRGKVPDSAIRGVIAIDQLQKSITRAEAKKPHKDLPPGGAWRTMSGHHIYILNGKILAGSIEGARGNAKKATKAHLAVHQEALNKEAKQKKKKPLYSKNEGASSLQNKKGESKTKGAGHNVKGKPRTTKGNAGQTRKNEASDHRKNGQGRVHEKASGGTSGSLHVAYNVVSDPKVFHKAIAKSKANNDHGAFVDLHDVGDYAKDKLLMSPKGGAGVAVAPDGNIISVFKDPAKKEKGAMHSIMMNALAHGGDRLDCFDGFLPNMYAGHGMIPVSKVKFSREYAPEGWNFERDGEPDVVFMAHNGDSVDEVQKKFGTYPEIDLSKIPYSKDYDAGEKKRNDFMKNNAEKKSPKTKGAGSMKKKEDLAKLPRRELDERYREFQAKLKTEADAKYSQPYKNLQSQENSLRRENGAIYTRRKSKAREKDLAENEAKINDIMKQQRDMFQAWQDHERGDREGAMRSEVRRRNERDDREMTGNLLPEEEKALDQAIGAKPFDPKASEEQFYRLGFHGWDKKAIRATPVDLGYGQEGFVTSNHDNTNVDVHFAKAGQNFVMAYPKGDEPKEVVLRQAVNQAKVKLKAIVEGDDYRKGIGKAEMARQLDASIAKSGLSPRYEAEGGVKKGKGVQVPKVAKVKSPKDSYHIFRRNIETKVQGYEPVNGTKVDIGHGIHAFIHGKNGDWTVSEARSGLKITSNSSKELAIKIAKDLVEKHGDKLGDMIQGHVDKHGESPKTTKTTPVKKPEATSSEVAPKKEAFDWKSVKPKLSATEAKKVMAENGIPASHREHLLATLKHEATTHSFKPSYADEMDDVGSKEVNGRRYKTNDIRNAVGDYKTSSTVRDFMKAKAKHQKEEDAKKPKPPKEETSKEYFDRLTANQEAEAKAKEKVTADVKKYTDKDGNFDPLALLMAGTKEAPKKGNWGKDKEYTPLLQAVDARLHELKKTFPVRAESFTGHGDLLGMEQESWDASYDLNIQDYAKENPELSPRRLKTLAIKRMTPRPDHADVLLGGTYSNENGMVSINTRCVGGDSTFDEAVAKQAKDLAYYAKRASEGKRLRTLGNVGDGMEMTMIHEYGHALNDSLKHNRPDNGSNTVRNTDGTSHNAPFNQKYSEERSSLHDYHKSLASKDIAEGLSEYATTNFSEFFSEAFLEAHMPNPRPIAVKFMKLLKEEMKNAGK